MSHTPATIANCLKIPVKLSAYLLGVNYSQLEVISRSSSERTLVFTSLEAWHTRRVERVALVQAEDTERLKVFDGVVAAMEHWDSSSEMLFESIAKAVENMK